MCESNKRKGEREREKERMKMKMKMRKRMNCARGACRGGGGGGARCKKHEGWMTRRETGLTMTTVKMSQSVLVAITMWREIGMNEGEAKAAQKSLRVPSRMSTQLPATGAAALRRSLPKVDVDVTQAMQALERARVLLRAPQSKPFGDVARCATNAAESLRSASVLLPEAERARQAAVDAADGLAERAGEKDAVATGAALAEALDASASLVLQMLPALPFALPRRFASMPMCTGRAAVKLEIGEERVPIIVTVDGFNAPLTAGLWLKQVTEGGYEGIAVRRDERSNAIVLAKSSMSMKTGAQRSGSSGGDNEVGPAPLPLEVSVVGDEGPRFFEPVDVLGGELPLLPLSVYGAVAMSHPVNGEEGLSDANGSFFIYLHDPGTAGLGGLAFDEGNYAVFGYVTANVEALGRLRDGDRVVSTTIVSGAERLILPQVVQENAPL